LKIPTLKKRKENRQRPRQNFLASSKNPDSERKKQTQKTKKKRLELVFPPKKYKQKEKNPQKLFLKFQEQTITAKS
jgi:hypothetical protein